MTKQLPGWVVYIPHLNTKHLVWIYKQATRQYAKLDEILGGA